MEEIELGGFYPNLMTMPTMSFEKCLKESGVVGFYNLMTRRTMSFEKYLEEFGIHDPKRNKTQEVMDSAPSMLEAIRKHLAVQSNASGLLDDTHPDRSATESYKTQSEDTEMVEFMPFGRRLVFRTGVPINANQLCLLHNRYKDIEALVNKSLELLKESKLTCSDEDMALWRSALRERFEGKLKSEMMLNGLIRAAVRQVDLLEEFWDDQGEPSDAEYICLSHASGQSIERLKRWFSEKNRDTQAWQALRRKLFPETDARKRARFLKEMRPYMKKPDTLH